MNRCFPLVTASGSFSITQWNTLADSLAMGFPAVNPAYLAWEHRFQKHIEHLKSNVLSDLICLEEVDHPDEFTAAFEATHSTIFHKKPEGQDGQLIAISKSKFELLDQQAIQYEISAPTEKPQNNESEDGTNIQSIPYKKTITNQSFFCLKLREKESEQLLTVFVTHLKAKPEFEHVRIQQIDHLLSFFETLKQNDVSIQNSPTIILGDLNTEPTSNVISRIQSQGFQSAYNLTDQTLFTTYKVRNNNQILLRTIDYIFYLPVTLRLVGTSGLPDKPTIGENGLPTETFPSDHLSLSAVFSFK